MTIELFRFQPGVEIDPTKEASNHALELVIRRWEERETLAPGEYDITPPIWRRNAGIYKLLVHENGKGTMRVLPKYRDTVSTEITPRGTSVKQGGRMVAIPEHTIAAVIAGPSFDNPRPQIHGVVFYHRGKSPDSSDSKSEPIAL